MQNEQGGGSSLLEEEVEEEDLCVCVFICVCVLQTAAGAVQVAFFLHLSSSHRKGGEAAISLPPRCFFSPLWFCCSSLLKV